MQHPVSYRTLPGQTDASSWSAATGTSTGFSPSRTMRTKAQVAKCCPTFLRSRMTILRMKSQKGPRKVTFYPRSLMTIMPLRSIFGY